ncbi:uncharacterized protein LOC132198579 [Neocloeon triangulifer]|uniref:uncharacterized protein LOC132198579 n=1 Tax=Neocloeon triangulifer TaxID=2078957 RepID=UPI00286EFE6F|nr:uncharacterized protein LOC132198579 [Neocloeon triangulifer]
MRNHQTKLAACMLVLAVVVAAAQQGRRPGPEQLQEPPEGYYAFEEAPNAEPPKVRRPPYLQTDVPCAGLANVQPHMSINNLCGDLNKGYIPKNPIHPNKKGPAYPFELIKLKTLDFFSKTLPILKTDDTLPKVAKFQDPPKYYQRPSTGRPQLSPVPPQFRHKRSVDTDDSEQHDGQNVTSSARQARKFCENGGGMLCMLYKAFRGEPLASGLLGIESRRDDLGGDDHRRDTSSNSLPQDNAPPTPCPARVEYATPVFAKNYQGVWRYVVQIPYEGYFTQTVEVTRCLNSKCHYLEGSCMSSPRWVSMLVAELYYPDSYFPNKGQQWPARRPVANEKPPPVADFQNYQQYLQKRAGEVESRIIAGGPMVDERNENVQNSTDSSTTESTTGQESGTYCDGVDELGCYQVRLYYDWFLVPGSCKCWRPDFFNRYTRRRVSKSSKDL